MSKVKNNNTSMLLISPLTGFLLHTQNKQINLYFLEKYLQFLGSYASRKITKKCWIQESPFCIHPVSRFQFSVEKLASAAETCTYIQHQGVIVVYRGGFQCSNSQLKIQGNKKY